MSEKTQRRLAAIVSADVVGYSRLMGVDEVGTHARLKARYSELVEPKIAEHGGRVVKLMGDGLLAEFPSVINAVNWALEVQANVAELDTGATADQRIEYRVGVNLGDVIVDGDDIFGDGVNVAARLQEIAETGGVCISEKVHAEVRGKLSAEFVDGGAQAVKNITEPVHVWRWSPNRKAAAETVAARPDEPLPLPDKPSIAVLPFDNMSGDPEQEYFADGITEDIITGLSKYRSLFVIARNTSFTFKGYSIDVKETAAQLGVRYVLEGSVRKAGSRVRVTAQLIEGGSGNHIWAERFDRQLADIFDLQDEITQTIVGAIEPEIGSVERGRAARQRPDNLAAWDLLQRGLSTMWRMDDEGLKAAERFLRQAIASDLGFAQAHSYLAFALLHQHYFGFLEADADKLTEAAHHAREASALDVSDALSHAVLARIFSHQAHFDDSIAEAGQGVNLNPNYAFAQFSLGVMYMWAGRGSEGLDAVTQAIRLSPKDPFLPVFLAVQAFSQHEAGHIEEAFETAKRACRMPHRDFRIWAVLVATAVTAGRLEDAREAAAKLLEVQPDFSISNWLEHRQPNHHPGFQEVMANKLRQVELPE